MYGDLNREGFRHLFETAPDAIVIVDAEGRIVLVNQQVERLFRFSRDELLGNEIEILIPGRFHGTHVRQRKEYKASPEVRPMGSGLELSGCRKDGSEFPVEISLSPVSTERGAFVSAIIRDVTARRALQMQTKRLQQYLLSAIDSIEGSFFIWDAEDRLVLCNSEARAQWNGELKGEMVGRSWSEIVDANLELGAFDLEGQRRETFREWLGTYHESPVGAFNARTMSGRSLRIVERRTPEGGTVALITDVTEEVEGEANLRDARAIAEAASSAKSEFLSSMSHELRTPLNAVLGFAQLLQRDKKTPLSPRQQERLGYVLRGGEHLLHLIDDVLDLARVEAGRVTISVEPVAVGNVLDEVETTIRALAERAEIDVEVTMAAALPEVRADRTRFKQILTNFASNAIKYGRPGGHVRIVAEQQQSLVRVSVIDDGVGIAADKQEKIFEPFHRAGQETGAIEGTGIGLTICKRLVKLMGGRVGFSSTQGEGSEFWVELPIHVASERPPAPRPAVDLARFGEGGPKLIVYVEDNPSNVAFMQDLLGDVDGVRLMVAPSAEVGIELIHKHQPALVIMDINLPGLSGIEALRHLKERPETRDIPVVALSAAAMVGEAKRITDAGFTRYLTKPVRVDELLEVLDELLS
jgi:PAS domain S-box-containing protein